MSAEASLTQLAACMPARRCLSICWWWWRGHGIYQIQNVLL